MPLPEQILYETRVILSDLGIPADDLSDDVIAREAILREMVGRLGGCRMLPGSWDKRFVREVATFPRPLTEKQEKAIFSLWKKYRGQLRNTMAKYNITFMSPMKDLTWAEWLPKVPEKM